ncbi:hypothetical protein BSG1_04380 [Bacillus sp. SG-1]|nr:hypothetical protein BSG1_04380 [Bacillus sp. SG-1]
MKTIISADFFSVNQNHYYLQIVIITIYYFVRIKKEDTYEEKMDDFI